jgi:uncharacterized membrane protein
MNTRLEHLLDRFKESLWAIPSALVVVALLAVAGAQALDARLPSDMAEGLRGYQPQSAEGVRAVLAAIATTMIGLAGVGFSITVVTLSLASSQFGSRLLRNFTRDPRNHTVLGVLVGAFVYCLALLVTVRVPSDESFSPPVVGVAVGFLFALAGLAAFVYFVHHVARQIQANHVIATVSAELRDVIDQFFPETLDPTCRMPVAQWHTHRPPEWQPSAVGAGQAGHVQALDVSTLGQLAARHGGAVEGLVHPGEFVNEGTEVFRFHGPAPASNELRRELAACCLIGRDRTVMQDFEFAIHQLVEIALRALSPSMNDPFTAMTCADHLGAAYARIGRRCLPANVFRDDEGTVRVVLPLVSFADVFDTGFRQIRQNARTSVAVSIHLLDVLTRLVPHLQDRAHHEVLARQARSIAAGVQVATDDPQDRAAIDDRLRAVNEALARASG